MGQATCLNCGRPGPVELAMKAKGGQTLSMLSCTRCENRSWLADGEPISSQDALKLAAADPNFVMTPSVTAKRRVAKR